MAAWDNISLPGPPAAPSYAAPLLNFAPIGNLASDYFQGTQQKRTLALQNAFKDGLPTLQDQNGNPVVDPQTGQPMLDVNAITQKAAKIGGLDAAVPFLSLQMKGQALGGVASAIAGGGAQGAPAAGAPQPQSAAVPAHGIPGGSSPPPGVSATGEGSQPDTLANIVQSQISDPVLAGKVMTAAAARLGIDPGQKIDPNNPTVQAYIRTAKGGVTPTGGTAGLPPGGTTQGMDLGTADALSQKAAQIRYAALRAEAFQPGLGKAALDQAQALDDRAKQIRDLYTKNAELTPDVKNYQAGSQPGETMPEFQARTAGLAEANKTDVTTFNKQATGIQTLATSSYDGLQKAALAKNLTLDPNFYSGPLSKEVETYNQFKSVFGSAPTSALPQEAFNKAANDMLQEQVKAMGGSGVGRVLQSEVNIMRQSIASLGITPASNRALLEIVSRVYKQQQAIGQIAQTVPRNANGQMTTQLNQKIAQYFQSNPLFTPMEIQHPQLLAAPDAPPQLRSGRRNRRVHGRRASALKRVTRSASTARLWRSPDDATPCNSSWRRRLCRRAIAGTGNFLCARRTARQRGPLGSLCGSNSCACRSSVGRGSGRRTVVRLHTARASHSWPKYQRD